MKVFISYRRGVSSGWAGRLAEKLKLEFGARNVFIDIEALQPGADFAQAISSAVTSCDALLAVISPDWISARSETGQRRLDDPDDFVRIEIASALETAVRVIPVLVGGAAVPKANELPPALQKLARRQAHELSDSRWDFDCQRLIQGLKSSLPSREAAGGSKGQHSIEAKSGTNRRLGAPLMLIGGVGLLIVIAYTAWRLRQPPAEIPPSTTTPATSVAQDSGSTARAPSGSAHSDESRTESRLPGAEQKESPPPVVPSGSSKFPFPTVQGFRVDVCLAFGKGCGPPAADEWCRLNGFSSAARFDAENVGKRGIQTKVIGTGEICTAPECTAFTIVECQ